MGRRLIAASALVFSAYACGAVGASAADPSWFSYSRPQTYSIVLSVIQVPMRDGKSLACYLSRPGTGTPGLLDPAGTPAAGKFPGIIDNYYGYTTLTTLGATGDTFASYGYNAMTCYVRGQGPSLVTALGDTYPSEANPQEAIDNYDMVEWLATQPFSDGLVGQTGGSYGAMTSNRVAALRPPHLVAIVPVSPTDSQYLESRYRGGALQSAGMSWAGADLALSLTPTPLVIAADYLQHPLYDDFWKQIDPKESKIDVPSLQLGGFADTDLTNGGFGMYQAIRATHPLNGDGGPYIVQGSWGHAGTPSEGNGFQLSWFDHWLKHMAKAPLPAARAEVFQLPATGGAGWQYYSDWPPPESVATTFHLNKDMTLSQKAVGSADQVSYTASSTDNLTAGTPLASSGQSLAFTTAPLASDLAIAGVPQVHLVASLSANDGIFVVQLHDVAPDGTDSIADAMPWFLKASHRLSHEQLTTITPGTRLSFDFPGWSIDYLFQKGHRIRLTVQSGDSNLVEMAPAGTVSVVTGVLGSSVDLPVFGAVKAAATTAPPAAETAGATNLPNTSGRIAPSGALLLVTLGLGLVLLSRRMRRSPLPS